MVAIHRLEPPPDNLPALFAFARLMKWPAAEIINFKEAKKQLLAHGWVRTWTGDPAQRARNMKQARVD